MSAGTGTGSSLDILGRIKRLLPNRWFKWVAPYRDAVIGGLSDSASWSYGLIGYCRSQTRLATAYGIWLDILAYDFLGNALTRNGSPDDTFRAVIKATILQERVTRNGMVAALTTLTGTAPWVFEPWNTYDTGAYSAARGGAQYGSMGYGVGRGGYGSMNLPGQTFMNVIRSASSGVPNVGGYTNNKLGYGVGSGEYVGGNIPLNGVTNAMILQMISLTKPTGTTVWTAIGGTVNPTPHRSAAFINKSNSQNIAII